ncbi:unnamed protein product [marine sediment metagenome]|uniref:Uncharacterized protein n=1 Tax=marine sediment metagenome TaxID=412755 RepID=X1ILD8_9ZZZZ
MPEEFLCKDKFGGDVYWNSDEFCETGVCVDCEFEKGKCPNKYIDEEDGDALYCVWYQSKKK